MAWIRDAERDAFNDAVNHACDDLMVLKACGCPKCMAKFTALKESWREWINAPQKVVHKEDTLRRRRERGGH